MIFLIKLIGALAVRARASSQRIWRDLGWQPQQQDLAEIIRSAWAWMQGAGPRLGASSALVG